MPHSYNLRTLNGRKRTFASLSESQDGSSNATPDGRGHEQVAPRATVLRKTTKARQAVKAPSSSQLTPDLCTICSNCWSQVTQLDHDVDKTEFMTMNYDPQMTQDLLPPIIPVIAREGGSKGLTDWITRQDFYILCALFLSKVFLNSIDFCII
jgi:hypothetical protein